MDSEPGPQGRGCRRLQAELSCSPQRKGETKAMKAGEGKRGRDRGGEGRGQERERAREGREEGKKEREGKRGQGRGRGLFCSAYRGLGLPGHGAAEPGSQSTRQRRDPALALLRPWAWPSLSELPFPCLEKGPELSRWGSQGLSYVR